MSHRIGDEMTQTLHSTRFGELEISDEQVLEFPEGLIGLGGHLYALLPAGDESPFLWLHSMEDPALALPVTNPHRFFEGFQVEISDEDAERLSIDGSAEADVYVTVAANAQQREFVANQRAPILAWAGKAYQVINRDEKARLRAELFAA
jgi:flagellar assembly factor FliW